MQAIRRNAPLLVAVVMRALAAMKVRETGGKNRGPMVDAIHLLGYGEPDGQPYCARSVHAALVIVGLVTFSRPDPRIAKTGSVHKLWLRTLRDAPELCTWAKNVSDPLKQIRPGDIMIRYELASESRGHVEGNAVNGHTEVVTRVYEDGSFDTTGGNTGSQFERDGEGFFDHVKLYSLRDKRVVGFIRPAFVPLDTD